MGTIIDMKPTLSLSVSYQIRIKIFCAREDSKKLWFQNPSSNCVNTLEIIMRFKRKTHKIISREKQLVTN